MQSFDVLSNERITISEILKPKFMEPAVVALPCWNGNYTVNMDAHHKHMAVSYYRKIWTELKDQ